MENNIKVSVIIPVYNSEKFICRCVDSVLNQTYKNLEIFLIDDGSPDNCPKICDEYAKKDERIRVFHNENGGASVARNFALEKMNGDYVIFIDSDDYIKAEMIETMLNKIQEMGGDVAICLEEHDDIESFKGDIFENILEDKIGSQMWRFLFKSDKFKTIRFPVGRLAQDVAVLHEVLYGSKIVFVPEKLYVYNVNNCDNVSNNKKNKYKGSMDRAIAFSKRYTWAKDKDDIKDMTKQIILYYSVIFCLSSYCRYRKNVYSKNDVNYIYQYLKDNKKEIMKSCKINMALKIAVLLLLLMPNLFSFIGSVVGI